MPLTFEGRRLDGALVRLERLVRRERVEESSAIPAAVMLDSATGYVRITTFVGEQVASDLHAALQRLESAGMERLVLDLRDNGGGSVDEAARVAGEFLPRGRIVFTATGRKAELVDTGRVQRSFWRSEKRYPMVVMINAGTASASELVAGALQDHDRALSYNPALFASPDTFARTRSLPAAALESFREFAAGRGVQIPSGRDADNVLQPYLLRVAASAKWGDEGGYLMIARLDPEIQRALTWFSQAAALAATVR